MRERHALTEPAQRSEPSPLDFRQRHYTVAEVAELWNLSPDAVRRLFENEPAVLALGGKGGRGRRPYTTLRIPENVVERVYRRQLSR